MIWGSYGDWSDFLDDFVRASVDKELVEELAILDMIDALIEDAKTVGNREQVFELHGKRYDWLRQNYLVTRSDATERCLGKVKAVVLTVDLAIKIFARLSQRHKHFLQRRVSMGIVDEVHNVSRDQLFALAAHIDLLLCAGDRFQDLRDDKTASGGSCVDWLLSNTCNHELLEVWRYGPDILELFLQETDREPFIDMVRKSHCQEGLETSIKMFFVKALQWDTLRNGCVWKCRALFSCILCCIVDAVERGCSTILVVTLYERIRLALETYLLDAKARCEGIWPSQLKVITAVTPEQYSATYDEAVTAATTGQCSGMSVDATVFLPAHRRHESENRWWTGHQAQANRRYVGNSRARKMLYILIEQPPANEKPVDEYWLRVAQALNAKPKTLNSGKDIEPLEWPIARAEFIFKEGEKLFNSVNWRTLADKICPYGATKGIDSSARCFFESRAQMQKELTNLSWEPTRSTPSMRRGIQRSIIVSNNTMDTAAESGEMESVTASGRDRENVEAWREVTVPSFTVLLTGAESAFMDFVFLPEWLPSYSVGSNDDSNDTKNRFEDFIVSLFTEIASSETEISGQRYNRRVDFHKLEEELDDEKYMYFFRHCNSTRLCVKLYKENSNHYLLYGYNGMGLHRSHPSWTSLVVRSCDKNLTARLISILSKSGPARHSFVNAVPPDCKTSFEDVLNKLHYALNSRGSPIMDFEGDPTACIETEHDSSTDESDVQEDFFDERGEEFEADYEQDSAQ